MNYKTQIKPEAYSEDSGLKATKKLDDKLRMKRTEITLLPIINELLRKLWIIALVSLVFAIGADIYCHLFVPPTYKSSFTAYVNNIKQSNVDAVSNADMLARARIVRTYSQVIKSKAVMKAAAEKLDNGYSPNELLSYVEVVTTNDSEVITVEVTTQSPDFSYDLANAIAEVAPAYMEDVVDGSSMRMIDSPELSTSSVGPIYLRWLIGGFAAGLIVMSVIIVIRFLRDDTVKSDSELEARFSLPVVGIIPDMDNAMSTNGYSYSYDYNYYNYEYGYGYDRYYYKSSKASGGDKDGAKK